MQLIKAQAYGNDFLLVDADNIVSHGDLPSVARRVCDRHRGIGADGLIVVKVSKGGAATSMFNQDGSRPEVSGNGIRCVGAWLAQLNQMQAGDATSVETDAGRKSLQLLEVDREHPARYRFRAGMGHPKDVRRQRFDLSSGSVDAVILNMGNPQCVVLGDVTESRLHSIGRELATHVAFPNGTNVELATVEAPDRLRILIWERGVGPTEASGTGACAAAVAAAAYGGAGRTVDVASPGGTQRVEWTDDGVWLSGWAELVATIDWLD